MTVSEQADRSRWTIGRVLRYVGLVVAVVVVATGVYLLLLFTSF